MTDPLSDLRNQLVDVLFAQTALSDEIRKLTDKKNILTKQIFETESKPTLEFIRSNAKTTVWYNYTITQSQSYTPDIAQTYLEEAELSRNTIKNRIKQTGDWDRIQLGDAVLIYRDEQNHTINNVYEYVYNNYGVKDLGHCVYKDEGWPRSVMISPLSAFEVPLGYYSEIQQQHLFNNLHGLIKANLSEFWLQIEKNAKSQDDADYTKYKGFISWFEHLGVNWGIFISDDKDAQSTINKMRVWGYKKWMFGGLYNQRLKEFLLSFFTPKGVNIEDHVFYST